MSLIDFIGMKVLRYRKGRLWCVTAYQCEFCGKVIVERNRREQ